MYILSIEKLHFYEINISDNIRRRGDKIMTNKKRYIRLKLDERIKALGITQKEYAEKVGMRPATVSQLVNNKYDRIELKHLLTIMDEMETTDFNDILTIEYEHDNNETID